MVLAFLPSVLQVDATLRAEMVTRMGATLRYRGLSGAQIDPGLPSGLLDEFARARGIPRVDLTPVFVAEHAAARGASLQAERHPLDAAREPRRRGGARRLPGAARLLPMIGR